VKTLFSLQVANLILYQLRGFSYRVARFIREEKLLGRLPLNELYERSLHNIIILNNET
jgi:hypothetical protein